MATAPKSKRIDDGSTKGESAAVATTDHGLLTERPEFLRKGGTSGRENITAEDILLPRLEIVQAISPAVTEGDGGFIPGAKAGDLVNSVTRVIYPRPLEILIVQFEKQFNIWKLRKFGGGFNGSFPTLPMAQQGLTDLVTQGALKETEAEILDTPTFFALIVQREDGEVTGFERISISMPRTKAKHARRLNTLIELTGEDTYNRVYAISTVDDENKIKQKYKNFSIDQLPGWPNELMVMAAEAFYKSITAGKVKVNRAGESAADDTAAPTEY